jgi:hypothetical protein
LREPWPPPLPGEMYSPDSKDNSSQIEVSIK